jgi:hypothetical protein
MNRFFQVIDRILTAVGLLPAESPWRWTGRAGWPRYEMGLSSDGYTVKAELTPSLNLPSNVGRFCADRAPGALQLEDGRYYLPRMNLQLRNAELMAAGLPRDLAARQVQRELEHEADLTYGYDRGYWTAFSLKLSVHHGRECLVMRTIDGISVDPVMLMVGRERHVTEMVKMAAPALIEAAMHQASRSLATEMSLRRG